MTIWRSGVAAPDSPLISNAIDHARSHYEPALFNHAIRSWLFAVHIARVRRAVVDDEVIAVSVLLHDLGLTPAFAGPRRFEVEGADAARAFAQREGVEGPRAWLVWDSVALHATPSIHQHKESEVALCGAGVMLDHAGIGVHAIPPDELTVILDAFPRLELKRVLKANFCRLALTKSADAQEGLVRDFGERFLAGRNAPNTVDLIMNAPFVE
jgi:hypothetical protein